MRLFELLFLILMIIIALSFLYIVNSSMSVTEDYSLSKSELCESYGLTYYDSPIGLESSKVRCINSLGGVVIIKRK